MALLVVFSMLPASAGFVRFPSVITVTCTTFHKIGINFADKRRLLSWYSSIVDSGYGVL
jgi:hypothetical protein